MTGHRCRGRSPNETVPDIGPALPSRHCRRGTMARGKSNREDGDPRVGVPEAMARRRRPLSEARGPLMSDECQLWVRS